MDSRTFLPVAACALAVSFGAAITAQAAPINVTYAYSATAASRETH